MLELCGVIAGGVFFEEFARFSTLAWICFPLGAVVVFYGLFNLTTRATGDPISIMPHLEDDVEECLLSEHDASLLDHHDHALEQHDGGLFDGVDDI